MKKLLILTFILYFITLTGCNVTDDTKIEIPRTYVKLLVLGISFLFSELLIIPNVFH
jgi:hypothetical protein